MRPARAARLFAHQALWRYARMRPAGRALVRELGSRDEDVRTIAAMFLLKSGRRSAPLLLEALSRRQHVPMVLRVLGDIGDQKLAPELQRFTADPDPRVAQAAQDALRVIDAQAPGV